MLTPLALVATWATAAAAQGPTIEVTGPTEGAEVRPGSRVTVTARVADSDGLGSVGLYWASTDNTLRCPGGNGSDWTCTRAGDVYTWVIELSEATGVRRYRVVAADAAGNQTITADRTLRVTPQPSAGTVALVSPASGATVAPGADFVFAAQIRTASSLPRVARVRFEGTPVVFALAPDPGQAGTWRLPAAVRRDAPAGEQTFAVDVTTESGETFTGGPYRLVIGAGGDPTVGNLPVHRYTTSRLTEGRADSILARGQQLLATDDGDYDVDCPPRPTLARDGPVQVFSFTDGNVDTERELRAILDRPGGGAYVVNEINWCSGAPRPGFSIIGCAGPRTPILVVRRAALQTDAILWMHEYGHVVRLGHRDIRRNVMFSSIGQNHTMVTAAQCDNFRGGGAAILAEGEVLPAAAVQPDTVPVLEFVRRVYVEGVPFAEAAAYGRADVPVLLEQLERPSEGVYLPTLVGTLGAIGDPRAVRPLIAFAERGSGALDDDAYGARKAALLALGHIAALARGRDDAAVRAALDYLTQGTDAGYWARTLRWTLPYEAAANTRDWQMAKAAVWGLAMSGRPAAAATLRGVAANLAPRGQAAPGAGRAAVAPDDFAEVLRQATRANEAVARIGLRAYYARDL